MIGYKTYTDKGTREINEDSISVAEKDGAYCFVLCDGLGGHGKGEIASAFVTEYLSREFLNCSDIDSFFADSIDNANTRLLEEQKKQGTQTEMKTTLVMLVISDGKYRYAHIGDSRLYQFRKNKVFNRTLDHSVPQMLAIAGDIKDKHIRHHPDRNRLLRVMGIEWESSKYVLSEQGELKDNDAFLLCSDGFWEPITEKEMCKLLKKSSSAGDWLDAMQTTVMVNGKETDMDNNSAIAVLYQKK